MTRAIHLGLIGWLALILASPLVAQPFTYQGFLRQGGQPVNGTTSLTFRLYDAPTGGNQLGSAITQNVNVQNGLFTVQLNFGNVWTGGDRYLEIQVGSTTLSPRVKIMPAPYASFAQRPWQTAGSNIFYNDGNVGIGTNSPAARLSLGGGNANTKLAIWQGGTASEVMGLGVGAAQFRLHLNNASDRFSFLNAPNGTEVMTIRGDGNVGIGTSSPQARLHVNGGNAYFTNNTTLQILPGTLFGTSDSNVATLEIPGDGTLGVWDNLTVAGTLRAYGDLNVGGSYFSLGGGTDPTYRRVEVFVDDRGGGAYTGAVRTLGPNGNWNTLLGHTAGYPNHGALAVADAAGNPQAAMRVEGDGHGVVWADFKLFRVPDPDDATRDIYYGCIEGPELAMYVRGTARLVNGRARIELPDHFRKLADEQGMTVQLTPRSAESKGLAAVRVSLDGIEVAELLNGRGNYEFDWRVEAVRKEHRDFQVYRPWDEVLLGGTDPAEAWQARLKSIQERQARQQSRTNTKGVQR